MLDDVIKRRLNTLDSVAMARTEPLLFYIFLVGAESFVGHGCGKHKTFLLINLVDGGTKNGETKLLVSR